MSDDPVRTVTLPASVWRVLWSGFIAVTVEIARESGRAGTDREQELNVIAVLQRAAMGFLDEDAREFWLEAKADLLDVGYELTSEHISTAARLVR